ncbi:hypothetical protein CLOM_g10346 [Closterium sp. NIES-68]|nr:hypothetical protein CLOM_g10346 [Closterium sp. NIES-68]
MMLAHGLVPPRRNYEGLIRMFLGESLRAEEGEAGTGEEAEGKEKSRAVESGAGAAGEAPAGIGAKGSKEAKKGKEPKEGKGEEEARVFKGFKELKKAAKAATEVEKAWEVYRQMKQFAELVPSRGIQEELWGVLTQRCSQGRHIVKAEELLRDMEEREADERTRGVEGEEEGEGGGEGRGSVSASDRGRRAGGESDNGDVAQSRVRAARYSLLLRHASMAGDVARTDNLLSRMRAAGIQPSAAALEAPVVACALAGKKRRDVEGGRVRGVVGGMSGGAGGVRGGVRQSNLAERAERGVEELESEGFRPGQVVLAALMEAYNLAGQHEKVLPVWPRVLEAGGKVSRRVKGAADRDGEGEGEMEGGGEGGEDKEGDGQWKDQRVMVRAYNAYVEGLAGVGEMERAEEVVGEMVKRGVVGRQLGEAYLSLLRGYVQEGGGGGGGEEGWGEVGAEVGRKALEAVGGCFRAMIQARWEPNQEAWNLYVRALIQAGERDAALKVYRAMQSEAERVTVVGSGLEGGLAVRSGPNQETFNMMIGTFGAAGDLDTVRSIYTDLRGGVALAPAAAATAATTAGATTADTGESALTDWEEQQAREAGEVEEVSDIEESVVTSLPAKLKARLFGPARRAAELAVGKRQLQADETAGLKLTQEQRQLLSGVILAGADVSSDDGAMTAGVRFAVEAGDERKERVLEHLYEMFGEWAAGPIVEEEEKEGEWLAGDDPSGAERASSSSSSTEARTMRVLTFSTVPHPSLCFYLHQYRPEKQGGRAAVPRLVHKWLTPRALAYWYMYAGQRGQPSQRSQRGSSSSSSSDVGRTAAEGSIILDAGMYEAKEVALIVKALKARTIDCAQSKRGKGSKGQRAVRFSGPSAQFLWKFMEPFVLEEMKEELNPVIRGSREVVGEERFVGGAKGSPNEEARESEEDRREGWVNLARASKWVEFSSFV